MIDFEQAITEWRREMLVAGLKTPALLDELENHLRESIAAQIESGSSAQESFEAALQRLGTPDALKTEFGKGRWPGEAEVRKWVGFGYVAFLGIYALLQLRVVWRFEPTSGELVLGIAGIVATLLTAYTAWRLVPGVMNLIPNKNVRSWVACAGGLSGFGEMMVFAWFVLPHLELTPGQFAAVFVWAMLPMVTFPTLLLGANWAGDETGKDGKSAVADP
jgi:hypothetical protein